MPRMPRMFCSCLARLPRMPRMPRWLAYCPHSNLLQCNGFLSSRADKFKEAGVSIKILRKEHAYKTEAIKMADGKVSGRLSRTQRHEVRFKEREISLLIGEWIKDLCLYDKGNQDYHDRNKKDIAKTQIVNSLNELLGYKTAAPKQSLVSQKL